MRGMISARSDNVEDDRRRRRWAAAASEFRSVAAASASAPWSCLASSAGRFGIDPCVLIGGVEMLIRRRQRIPAALCSRTRAAPARRKIRPVTSSRACSAIPKIPGREIFKDSGQQYQRAEAASVHRLGAGRLRPCAVGDGAVLLPERSAHLPRHLVLPRHAGALPRLQRQGVRIRRSLCDRARGRPSRAEPARHPAEGAAAQQRGRQQGRGEPHPGAGRIAGRLSCRRVGEPLEPEHGSSIEPGDAEAALQTASAIGDDRLQKQARGNVVPDAFTHGTSAQRQHWFTTGLKQGTISACNTFAADAL